MYWSIIRQIVTYFFSNTINLFFMVSFKTHVSFQIPLTCFLWFLSKLMFHKHMFVKHGFWKKPLKNKLIVCERKVLRNIFGLTKERDGTWRNKTNDELDELIRKKNIINYVKSQILSWFGHLHWMSEERMVKKVYKWKPKLTRPLGRPKNRWEDDIRDDMKKLKIKNWISCIQDRNKRKLYVEKAKTFEDWSCSAWRRRRNILSPTCTPNFDNMVKTESILTRLHQ